MVHHVLCWAAVLSFCFLCLHFGDGKSSPTLVKAFIATRHGSRAPAYETYHNDSFKKDDKRFWPAGPGELTKVGKNEAFELGQKLRLRYDEFLCDYYTSKEFQAFSTLKERNLMSAQLTLAAMFPPKGYQKWNSDFNWQPIPIYPEYAVNRADYVKCPWLLISSKEEMMTMPASDFGLDDDDLALLFPHIGPYDKDPFNFMSKLWDVWDTVYFQDREGLLLPDWLKTIYPDTMSAAVLKYVRFYLSGIPARKEIFIAPYGKALTNFFSDLSKKMELHTWHDVNIIALMTLLRIDIEKTPEPASALAIELHNRNNSYFFEIYYYPNGKAMEPKLLKMPCGISCPLSDLIELFKIDSDIDVDEVCHSRKNSINNTLKKSKK